MGNVFIAAVFVLLVSVIMTMTGRDGYAIHACIFYGGIPIKMFSEKPADFFVNYGNVSAPCKIGDASRAYSPSPRGHRYTHAIMDKATREDNGLSRSSTSTRAVS